MRVYRYLNEPAIRLMETIQTLLDPPLVLRICRATIPDRHPSAPPGVLAGRSVINDLYRFSSIILFMTYKSIHEDSNLYFITASICGWKPIFKDEAISEIILEALNTYWAKSDILLFAYVIMPTHVHAILKPLRLPIGQFLQRFGSVTAHSILKHLKVTNCTELLDYFHMAKRDPRDNYSIWQDIQAKNIFSNHFLAEKLEYLHNNPVSGKWNLARDRAEYHLSSAMYYDLEKQPMINVDNIWDYLS
jgi:putative transposase